MDPIELQSSARPEPDGPGLEAFAIRGEAAIRALLESVARRNTMLTVFAHDDHDTFLVTRIDAIGARGLVVDLTTESARAHRLADGGRSIAVCRLDGVKLQIPLGIERIDGHEGTGMSMRCSLPEVVYRLQRRDGYRVRPMPGHAAAVVLRDGRGGELRYELYDISVAGLSFIADADRRWTVGDRHEHARLYLGVYSPLPCTLDVSSLKPFVCSQEANERWHVGCAFRYLSGEVERDLQRFVTDFQRATRMLPPL